MTIVIVYVRDQRDRVRANEFLLCGEANGASVVVVHDDLDAAWVLEFLQHGAVECLGRPLNINRLSLVLDMLASRILVASGRESSRDRGPSGLDTKSFFPGSASMAKLLDQVRLVAPLDTTVLITGETGTGKTRLSHLIHELSPRRGKQFVAVNCGALSPGLVESELFGHARGAFTGADREHVGKFAQCGDGTLLLDEIDTLTLEMQVKFLRAVEERTFEAVGAERSQQLRARLIVATNRPLEEEVAEGRFRSDLYYRLNIMSFHLPPLRRRRGEIVPLIETFIEEFAQQHALPRPTLTAEARSDLEAYEWPGNIRQLRNVVERAVILASGAPMDRHVLPDPIAGSASTDGTKPESVKVNGAGRNKLASARWAAEKSQLHEALQRNGNNRSKTAADLGISRVALYKRLRKFQIV